MEATICLDVVLKRKLYVESNPNRPARSTGTELSRVSPKIKLFRNNKLEARWKDAAECYFKMHQRTLHRVTQEIQVIPSGSSSRNQKLDVFHMTQES